MCNYQHLYYKEKVGYVSMCVSCENLHIAYGTILLSLPKGVLADFQQLLDALSWDFKNVSDPYARQIYIPMPGEAIGFFLNRNELSELMDMLDAADSELQSLALIELLHKQNYK